MQHTTIFHRTKYRSTLQLAMSYFQYSMFAHPESLAHTGALIPLSDDSPSLLIIYFAI